MITKKEIKEICKKAKKTIGIIEEIHGPRIEEARKKIEEDAKTYTDAQINLVLAISKYWIERGK